MSGRDVQPIDVVLGELTDAQRAEAERLMRDDAEFRREVDELRPVALALEELPEEAWEPPTPPPLDLPEAQTAPAPARERRRWWPELSFPALAAVGASALVLLGIGVGIGVLASDDGGPDRGAEVALAPIGEGPEAAAGRVTVLDGERVELDVERVFGVDEPPSVPRSHGSRADADQRVGPRKGT